MLAFTPRPHSSSFFKLDVINHKRLGIGLSHDVSTRLLGLSGVGRESYCLLNVTDTRSKLTLLLRSVYKAPAISHQELL